jgi:sugar phosphate isomerase/epimerase
MSRKKKITSSPWGFRMISLEKQCQWLVENHIDYICGQFADYPGMFRPGVTRDDLIQAGQIVKSYGLQYASFNVSGDFMVRDGLEKEIADCCRDMDLASTLSPRVIIVFAGWQDRSDAAVYDQVADALKQVARHAAKYDYIVALENHGGLTRTAEQINQILSKVNEPNIGLNYDPANFLMYDVDPYMVLDQLDCPIVFSHLKSVKYTDGKKVYCRLSEGMINYEPILRKLNEMPFNFYSLEYEEPSDVFEGSLDDLSILQQCLLTIRSESGSVVQHV